MMDHEKSPSPTRVLVADANPGARAFLQETLESKGFEVSVVPYGSHALELLHKEKYDVALVDLTLPDLNGFELCTQTKQQYPDLVTIIMSESASDAEKDLHHESVDAWLPKPFNAGELLQVVNRYLQPVESSDQTPAAAPISNDDKDKNRFFHEVAHQLKTPIAVLKEFAQLFQEGFGGDLTEKQGQYLEAIDHNIDRLLYLVDHIDQLNRVETGSWSIRLDQVDPADVVKKVADNWRPVLEKSDSRLVEEVTEGLPPIEGDIRALEQVLFNMVDNARKYGPPGGTIILRCALSGDDHVCIEVEDQGVPIPDEQREAVFQPFKRLPEHQSSAGLGLGLTVARDLVQRMGGELRLESGIEAGNRFCLQIRVAGTAD
ncbi:ATP-binding protein [Candidatus Neomarinimicrobiota bacterium]